jgi:hypothetical protein
LLSELEAVALERMGRDHSRQNVVTLRDGATVNGNRLVFLAAPRDPATGGPYLGYPDQVVTQTADQADCEVLRRASFDALAELEELRAAGTADPRDPEQRRTFTDAAYFLVQGPEFKRGSDATRTVPPGDERTAATRPRAGRASRRHGHRAGTPAQDRPEAERSHPLVIALPVRRAG